MTPAPAPAAPVVTAKIPAHAVDIAKIDLSAVPPKPEERPEVEAPFVAPPPIEPPSVPNLPVGIDAIDLAPPTPVVVEAPVNETAPLTEEPNIAPIPVETPAPIAAAPTPRPFGSMPEIERRPIELMGRETLEEHITSLEAPEPNRRLIAAMALRLRGGPEHIEPLRAAFQRERDAAAKVEMRRALVALGGSPNPPPAPQISAPVVKLPPEDPRPATVLGPESPASTFNPATPLIKIPDPVATPKTSSPKIKATPKAGPTPEAPAIQVDAAPPKPIETR